MLQTDTGRSALLGFVNLGMTMVLQLATPVVLLRRWGDSGFALFIAVRGVANYAMLADAGLQAYLTQRYALLLGSGELAAAVRLVQAGWRALLWLACAGFVLVTTGFLLLGPALWRTLAHASGASSALVLVAFIATSAASVVALSFGGWSSVVEIPSGRQTRMQSYSLLRNFITVGLFIPLAFVAGPMASILFVAFVQASMDLYRWSRTRRLVPNVDCSGASPVRFWALTARSSLGMLALGANATQSGLQPAVAAGISAPVVGVAVPARTLANASKQLGSVLGNAIWPPLTKRLAASASAAERIAVWKPAATALVLLNLAGIGLVGAIAPLLLPHWVPSKAAAMQAILPVLLLEQVALAAAAPSQYFLATQGAFGRIGSFQLVGAILGTAILPFLVTRWGAFGMAWAGAIGTLIVVVPLLLWSERALWRGLGASAAPDQTSRLLLCAGVAAFVVATAHHVVLATIGHVLILGFSAVQILRIVRHVSQPVARAGDATTGAPISGPSPS
jgi:hypothetical protein